MLDDTDIIPLLFTISSKVSPISRNFIACWGNPKSARFHAASYGFGHFLFLKCQHNLRVVNSLSRYVFSRHYYCRFKIQIQEFKIQNQSIQTFIRACEKPQ